MDDEMEDTDDRTGSGGLEASEMLCSVRLGIASMRFVGSCVFEMF